MKSLRRRSLLVALGLLSGCPAVWAQAPGATLLQNVRIYDGRSASLTDARHVLVRGEVIERISATPIDAPAGATIIDGGATAPYPAKRAQQVALDAAFGELLRWEELYGSVTITGRQRVGDDQIAGEAVIGCVAACAQAERTFGIPHVETPAAGGGTLAGSAAGSRSSNCQIRRATSIASRSEPADLK